MDFINSGPECYKKLVFSCLSMQNQGRICEHDMFGMIENFKQKDNFFFYKELITMKDVPRDFNSYLDFSDRTFFEAFSSDVNMVSRGLNLRKHLMG